MVFPLYKKRDFGEYISDSLQFFKKFWKNYLQNYITLNGALLLILCLIYFFIFKDFFGEIMANPTAQPSLFLDENIGVTVTLLFVGFIVVVIFSVITVAYPIAYFRLVERTDNETFTNSEILNEIKKDIGKIILFGLLSIVTYIPIFMVYFVLSAVFSVILIGIPFLILGMGAAMTWMNQALYIYLNEKVGFFEAMGGGWRTLMSKFWHIAGASTAMIFIVSTLSSVLSMIPYFIGIAKMFSTGSSEPDISASMPWFIAFYVINIVLSYLLNNFIYINQGLIYYSSKEEMDNLQAISEIETIGNNEE